MSYDPKTYWPARYAKEGALACARKGMDEAASGRQMEAFWPHIAARVPRPCRRLLDFGCGPGRLYPHLCREALAAEYHGVDACPEAVELARRVADCERGARRADPPAVYAHLPGGRIPSPDELFDCVVCCTVLQHIVDDAQFAHWTGEIARVTRPGGTVIVLDGVGCKAAHARSRAPEDVGAALGMGAVGPRAPVSAESKGSHWCASYVKGP